MLVAVTAGSGAVLRRAVGRFGLSALGQCALAALVAGLVGGIAVRYALAPDPDLVALCACMILVPGPHILNGGLDGVSARLDLALVRLGYAATLLVAIGLGLLAGMGLWGVSLPLTEPSSATALWWEIPAAGVAGYAYSTFFNTPGRLIGWPVVVGALAHAVHWIALRAGAKLVTATLLACLMAATVVAPVTRRRHLPFAPLAFASVVSMVPGVYVFPALSGLSHWPRRTAARPCSQPRWLRTWRPPPPSRWRSCWGSPCRSRSATGSTRVGGDRSGHIELAAGRPRRLPGLASTRRWRPPRRRAGAAGSQAGKFRSAGAEGRVQATLDGDRLDEGASAGSGRRRGRDEEAAARGR